MLTIGIDLGGTSLRVGLFDESMKLIASRTLLTRVAMGPDAVVSDMAGTVRDLLAPNTPDKLVNGIGIGSPGPLNLKLGRLEKLPNFPGWDDYPLRERLEAATSLPVTLECDANAAALAEWKFGAGRHAGVDSMAMITLGTGVGSGIILAGRMWHGMVGMGGEVGHNVLDPDGPACGCGSHGCLEVYASAGGLLRIARQIAAFGEASQALVMLVAHPTGFTPREVAELAETGDSSARGCFEKLGSYLGFGLAGLANTLDLPLIVIGGGVAEAWPLFSPAMFASLERSSNVYRAGRPTQRETLEPDKTFIRPAMLGPAAGLIGAALLPRL